MTTTTDRLVIFNRLKQQSFKDLQLQANTWNVQTKYITKEMLISKLIDETIIRELEKIKMQEAKEKIDEATGLKVETAVLFNENTHEIDAIRLVFRNKLLVENIYKFLPLFSLIECEQINSTNINNNSMFFNYTGPYISRYQYFNQYQKANPKYNSNGLANIRSFTQPNYNNNNNTVNNNNIVNSNTNNNSNNNINQNQKVNQNEKKTKRGLSLVGQAIPMPKGNGYVLSQSYGCGGVWSYNRVSHLNHGFQVSLSFCNKSADGFAFVIQNSRKGNKALGTEPSGMGLNIENSFAVLFSFIHYHEKYISVQCNKNNQYGTTTDSRDTIARGKNLSFEHGDPKIYHSIITYNSKKNTLTVVFDGEIYLEVNNIDLTKMLKLHEGHKAFIGFTSSCRYSGHTQSLLSCEVNRLNY